MAATLLGALVNGLLNSFLVTGCRRIGLGAVAGNQKCFVLKMRCADALLDLPVFGIVPALGNCHRGKQQPQHHNYL